ncbi:hypothetical protein QQZ08_006852 [Neonectria magnoliae]|uniref:Uncharacterized protein n=1 Tax=Neonectria magnoliae TaxID=2732573 RepID=A0ABR1I094_9HYPO
MLLYLKVVTLPLNRVFVRLRLQPPVLRPSPSFKPMKGPDDDGNEPSDDSDQHHPRLKKPIFVPKSLLEDLIKTHGRAIHRKLKRLTPDYQGTIWKNQDFRIDAGSTLHGRPKFKTWNLQVNRHPLSDAAKALKSKFGTHKKLLWGAFDVDKAPNIHIRKCHSEVASASEEVIKEENRLLESGVQWDDLKDFYPGNNKGDGGMPRFALFSMWRLLKLVYRDPPALSSCASFPEPDYVPSDQLDPMDHRIPAHLSRIIDPNAPNEQDV